MTINYPTAAQLPALRELWREAFPGEDDFFPVFTRHAMSAERCRCALVDGRLAGAYYWLHCSFGGKPLAYIYGLAVAKSHRGQGIGQALMADAHKLLASLGYRGVLLVPGNGALWDFYSPMGYSPCCPLRQFCCAAGPEDIPLYPVDGPQYAKLRRQLLPPEGVVQEGESMDLLAATAQLYAGSGFLLAARREGDTLVGLEYLGDEGLVPAILETLACTRGNFRTPGAGPDHALYKALEEGPAPGYFGLPFDI